jgi:polyisoprenoid-binding protein YceI
VSTHHFERLPYKYQKMKKYTILSALLLSLGFVSAQNTFFTKSANVQFDATAKNSPEEITAKQNSGTLVMTESGTLEAAILVKSFLFKQALMQEHFNENYMESSKFPKAIFKGKVSEGKFSLTQDGTYQVKVAGTFTMHGISKEITVPGKISVKGGKVSTQADFSVTLADYGISVPGLVADKLAKEAKISIKADLTKK